MAQAISAGKTNDDTVTYYMSDGTDVVFETANRAQPDSGPIKNNPADLVIGPTNINYFAHEVGEYPPFGIYDSRLDGVLAVAPYLQESVPVTADYNDRQKIHFL